VQPGVSPARPGEQQKRRAAPGGTRNAYSRVPSPAVTRPAQKTPQGGASRRSDRVGRVTGGAFWGLSGSRFVQPSPQSRRCPSTATRSKSKSRVLRTSHVPGKWWSSRTSTAFGMGSRVDGLGQSRLSGADLTGRHDSVCPAVALESGSHPWESPGRLPFLIFHSFCAVNVLQ
jgi:hypothetical protein